MVNSAISAKQISEVLKKIKGLIDTTFKQTVLAQQEMEQVVNLSTQVISHENMVAAWKTTCSVQNSAQPILR